jgi:preprotein translocase subunit SecF
MRTFRLVPDGIHIRFMHYQYWGYAFSGALILLTLILVPLKGLNFGVDFRGGLLIEARLPGTTADLATMRSVLGDLGLGEVALQTFGEPNDVLIRVQRQEGGEEAQLAAVEKVKSALNQTFGDVSYRRVESVGPKVSSELLWSGAQAVIYSFIAILAYVWFRFEWQYGVGTILALIHDVVTTIGIYCLLDLEFNLTSIAALLTIVGYSLNDTVVIFDRVRENLRSMRRDSLGNIINVAINQTLGRTVITSGTALLSSLALLFFGGDVLHGFAFTMVVGIITGTYSTVFIAAAIVSFWRGGTARAAARAPASTTAPAPQQPQRKQKPQRKVKAS